MIFVYVIFIKRLQLMIKSHDYDECQSNRKQCPTGTKYLPATRTWQGVSGIMLYIHLAHYITTLCRPVKSASVAKKITTIGQNGQKNYILYAKKYIETGLHNLWAFSKHFSSQSSKLKFRGKKSAKTSSAWVWLISCMHLTPKQDL